MKSSVIFVVFFIAISLNSYSAAVDSVDGDDQQLVGGKSITEKKKAKMVEKAFGIIKEKLQNKKYEDVEIALNEKKTMTKLIADEISILINETKSMKLIYEILKKFAKQIKNLSANFEIKKILEKLMKELANKVNKIDLNKSVLIFLQEKIQAEVKADPNLNKMVNSQIITMFIQQIPIIYEEELRNLEMLKKNKKSEIESKVVNKLKQRTHLRSASLGEENFPQFRAKISGQNKSKLAKQKYIPDMINLMDMEWPSPSMEGNLMKQQSAPDLHYEDSPNSQYEANMNKLKDLVIPKSETNILEHNEDGNKGLISPNSSGRKSPKMETHIGGGNSPHKNDEEIFHMDMVPKLTKIKTKVEPENDQKSPRKYAGKIGSPAQSEGNGESPQSGKNHHLENEHEFRGKHYLEKETLMGMVKTPSESSMASFWSNHSSPKGMMEDNSEWQFKNRNNDQQNLVRTNTAVFTALEQENMMAELAKAMQDLEQTSNIEEEENAKEGKINGNGSQESIGENIQIDSKNADGTNMAVTKRKKWDKVQSFPPTLLSNPTNWASSRRNNGNLPKNVKSPNPLPVPAIFNVQQNNRQIEQSIIKDAKLDGKSDGYPENSHHHLDASQQKQSHSPRNLAPKNNSDQNVKNPSSLRQEKQLENESPTSSHDNVHPNLANEKEAEEDEVDQNAVMVNQIGSPSSRKMMGNEEEMNGKLAHNGNEMSPKSPQAILDGNEEIRSNIEKSDSIKSDSLHQNPADESTNSNGEKTIGQIQNDETIERQIEKEEEQPN